MIKAFCIYCAGIVEVSRTRLTLDGKTVNDWNEVKCEKGHKFYLHRSFKSELWEEFCRGAMKDA